MTTEEKAKAYDEALATAKRVISNNCTEVEKLCLKCVFPELQESKDEKTRKQLISICNEWLGGGFNARPCLDDVRWLKNLLEKQKEQKHPNGCFTCDEYKKGYEEGRRNGFTAGYNKAMKEVEQKEQKPVDYDHEMWKNCEANFEGGKKEVIENPEKYGLQKHVEWSEEDEKHINIILRVLDRQQCWDGATGKKFNPYQGEIDWLKSLRPQPKQE